MADARLTPKMTAAGLALASSLLLAGCGYNPGDRALSGGLIGAGAGLGVAAVAGGSLAAGAAIGAAAGAVGGAVTSPHHINLGRPPWR